MCGRLAGRGSVLLVCFAVLAGCKTVYVPNLVNVPLLREKGELRASVSPKDLQVAYAVSDRVGLLAQGYFEKSEPDPGAAQGLGGQGSLLELGGGTFLQPAGFPGDPVLELYGGLGYGQVRHDNWETVNGMRMPYRYQISGAKLFLQPSLGFTRDWLDVAISGRLAGIRAFDARAENYPEERLKQDKLWALDDTSWLFWEPALTVRAGYKWVKAFAQYGYSIKLNGGAVNRRADYFYVGLHFTFARRFRAR